MSKTNRKLPKKNMGRLYKKADDLLKGKAKLPKSTSTLKTLPGVVSFHGKPKIGDALASLYLSDLLDELHKYQDDLEILVDERTATLQKTNEELIETKQKLLDINKLLEFILDSAPAAIYYCTAENNYSATYISQSIKKQLGFEPREFTDDCDFWVNNI
ncbi:hypothetical protein ACFL54_06240, partial [Planctomycetota bacterium]